MERNPFAARVRDSVRLDDHCHDLVFAREVVANLDGARCRVLEHCDVHHVRLDREVVRLDDGDGAEAIASLSHSIRASRGDVVAV